MVIHCAFFLGIPYLNAAVRTPKSQRTGTQTQVWMQVQTHACTPAKSLRDGTQPKFGRKSKRKHVRPSKSLRDGTQTQDWT